MPRGFAWSDTGAVTSIVSHSVLHERTVQAPGQRAGQKCGYEVRVYDRSRAGEKKVDVAVASEMTEVVCTKQPGTLVLVLGDGDYEPVIIKGLSERTN